MGYRFLDHTGDVAVEVTAATPEALFEEAAVAMADCVTDPATLGTEVTRSFCLEADELELLMVEWLSELLYVFETEGLLLPLIRVDLDREAPDGPALSATARGEVFDPDRHPLEVLIKGVTYHALEVVETAEGWRARVVFDI